jgi:acyl-coenzyme A synthetase/AMP-(fatty) acid ligase
MPPPWESPMMITAKRSDELGEFKTPKVIKVMDELPKGPSGKIQRLKLPDMVKHAEEDY